MPQALEFHCQPLGDAALLIEFSDADELHRLDQIMAAQVALSGINLVGRSELVPGLASLTWFYDATRYGNDEIAMLAQQTLQSVEPLHNMQQRCHQVPICYDLTLAPDLNEVAQRLQLKVDQFIELHSSLTFRVGMIGFLPGFPYLLGLPATLQLPRRATPRTKVPAGSVAIANNQCGIYPVASPGGWHLIGRTPSVMFDWQQQPPSRLHSGDQVRFVPISSSDYVTLAQAKQ